MRTNRCALAGIIDESESALMRALARKREIAKNIAVSISLLAPVGLRSPYAAISGNGARNHRRMPPRSGAILHADRRSRFDAHSKWLRVSPQHEIIFENGVVSNLTRLTLPEITNHAN